jgi:hypothetical protein
MWGSRSHLRSAGRAEDARALCRHVIPGRRLDPPLEVVSPLLEGGRAASEALAVHHALAPVACRPLKHPATVQPQMRHERYDGSRGVGGFSSTGNATPGRIGVTRESAPITPRPGGLAPAPAPRSRARRCRRASPEPRCPPRPRLSSKLVVDHGPGGASRARRYYFSSSAGLTFSAFASFSMTPSVGSCW